MRKCFTGRVGDASFQKALAFILEGGKSTLFVNDGAREKAIHFSPDRLLFLPWDPADAARAPACLRSPAEPGPPGEAPAATTAAAPDAAGCPEEVRKFLRSEVEDIIASWTHAPFEVREGPVPVRSPLWSKALEVRASPRAVLAGIAKTPPAPGPASPPPALPDDPLARTEVLASSLAGRPGRGPAAHVLLRELAAAWKEVGSVHRAAQCLRALAAHHGEWGDEESARKTLEQALALCPADAKAAEQLIGLHAPAGRHREAEAVAEGICRQLESWKLHDVLARFYKMLGRAPESAVLRRVGAEAMIRSGDVSRGLKEMSAVAALLESKGDKDGARTAFERVSELDPANAAARKKVAGARRRDLWVGCASRWGSLAAAIVLAASWVLWDVAAASALEKVKIDSPSDPREELAVLRTEASSFPVTRQPARLASREEQVYERSLDESWKLIREAIEARAAGDAGTAYHILGTVAKRTLIPALAARAVALRAEIQRAEDEREGRLRHAAKLVQGRDFEAAGRTYIEILARERRSIQASIYSVPVLVDSIPRGAEIEVDRKQEGRTPRWVFLSPDPDSVLKLSLGRFQGIQIRDPLSDVVRSGAPRLRKALVPESGWRTASWGGTVAVGARLDGPVIPILGADGVLRGIAPGARKPSWETPLDGPFAPRGAPVAAGPVVGVATGSGALVGFAVSSGRVAWTLNLGERGGPILLGPVLSGQISAMRGTEVILVNPQSGLVQRKIDAGFEVRPEGFAVAGNHAFAVDARGRIARIALRGARRDVESDDLVKGPALLFSRGEGLIAVSRSGRAAGLPPALDGKAWEVGVGGEARAACAAGGTVCIASPGGALVCLDAVAGTPLWKAALDGEVTSLSPAGSAAEALAATITREGRACAVAIGLADGALLWEVEAGRGEEPSVVLDGRSAVVSSPSLGVIVLPVSVR
jgi:outer membrane protein assembly factor BamB/tetratricopeptide (TPR) repeat protein